MAREQALYQTLYSAQDNFSLPEDFTNYYEPVKAKASGIGLHQQASYFGYACDISVRHAFTNDYDYLAGVLNQKRFTDIAVLPVINWTSSSPCLVHLPPNIEGRLDSGETVKEIARQTVEGLSIEQLRTTATSLLEEAIRAIQDNNLGKLADSLSTILSDAEATDSWYQYGTSESQETISAFLNKMKSIPPTLDRETVIYTNEELESF